MKIKIHQLTVIENHAIHLPNVCHVAVLGKNVKKSFLFSIFFFSVLATFPIRFILVNSLNILLTKMHSKRTKILSSPK